MIEEVRGDLLAAEVDALVNAVNTVGVMGKGIALRFKQDYPANYAAYRDACRRQEVELGRMFVHETGARDGPRYVVNFPTKKHWRSRSTLPDIEAGLVSLRRVVAEHGIRSIAVPPLGCGHGGLDWADVYPLLRAGLGELSEVRVLVYPPVG